MTVLRSVLMTRRVGPMVWLKAGYAGCLAGAITGRPKLRPRVKATAERQG